MSQEAAASLRRRPDLAFEDGGREAMPERLANQFGWAVWGKEGMRPPKVPTDPFSTCRPAAGAVV